MSGPAIASQAQPPGPIELTLPAFGVARTPAVNVRAGETVTIRPARLGELIPAIFVYDDGHTLVAKNDETRGGGVFDLLIHDVDVWTHGIDAIDERFREAMAGAYVALDRLRAQRALLRASGSA